MAGPSVVVLVDVDAVLDEVDVEVDEVDVEVDVVRFGFDAFEVDGAADLSDPPHATAASATVTTTARRTRNCFRRVVMGRP
jgi:hypothetical protein